MIPDKLFRAWRTGALLATIVPLLGCLWPATQLAAQEPWDIEVINLGVLHGAPEPDPALKYLFGSYVESPVSENAAFHYQRAMRRLTESERSFPTDRFPWETEWLSLSPEQLDVAKVGEFLLGTESTYEMLERASRCQYCEWLVDTGSAKNLQSFININLNDMQEARRLARYLELKARYEIRQKDFDSACETMRTAYQLGYDVQEFPLIITGLIGGAIQGMTNAEVANWIATEKSPNLYWALRSLRRPPVDLTECIMGEMRLFTEGIEAFHDPEQKDWPAEQWATSLAEDFQAVVGSYGGGPQQELAGRLMVSGMLVRGFPRAKRALLAEGYTLEKINDMPVAQVVCIHQALIFRRFLHDELKWQFVEPPEGPRRYAMQAELHRELQSNPANSDVTLFFLPMLMPAFGQVRQAEIRLQRDVNALITLEAIRMHTAQTGKPPQSLADITVVPVPLDPSTGALFNYKVSGSTVDLALPAYPFASRSKIYRWTRAEDH